ncbi:MAG: hypothetical protein HKN08_07370 [Gammaproteobacteria bacterium]|nr:hypothetical protein [Gammaproteobacteria bacterium]
MTLSKKNQIYSLLKGIETGDSAAVTVVNEEKYIQHNPQTHEGSEGLAVLFKRLSETSPKVNIMRIFEDGDFVFAHTEYDFSRRNIGFEIFRFEDGQAVEHWDNIQQRQGPNHSGHSMVDGPTEVTDHHLTQNNRSTIQQFLHEVLIPGNTEKLENYVNIDTYKEHNPGFGDDMKELIKILSDSTSEVSNTIQYKKCHRLLAEGNFVLSVCEGILGQSRLSFYDLFRLENGKIVEHWDTTEVIPPQSEWKNNNGKF